MSEEKRRQIDPPSKDGDYYPIEKLMELANKTFIFVNVPRKGDKNGTHKTRKGKTGQD